MIKSFIFSLLFISIWYFTWATELTSFENALVFDPVNVKLRELNEKSICQSICLLACPAYQEGQRLVDKYGSVTGEGVYVHSTKTVNSKAAIVNKSYSEIDTNVCPEQYKPVMVRDTETESYETGYELFYFDDGETFTLPNGMYDKLEKVTNRKPNKGEFKLSDTNRISRIKKRTGNTVFEVYTDSIYEWTFFWISVLSIQVSKQQRQIKFKKDQINDDHQIDQTMLTCGDYSLDDHESVEKSQEKLSDNQDKLSTQEKNTDLKENSPKQVENSLEEIQIMPMRYFHTLSARLATCTDLNMAHVTKSTAERLKEVDLYLYSIYRAWPSKIDIIFGITGESKELNLEVPEIIKNPVGRKFPSAIPEILYRIVEYEYNDIKKMQSVIVVIHNVLRSVSKEERICPPEAELKGWNDLGQGNASGLTYTCPVTLKTIQKLEIKYEHSWVPSLNLSEDQQEKILKQKESLALKATADGKIDDVK